MTILTPRRLANRRVEPTQQLIVFRLQQEWFALPILMVQKVVPLDQVYGAPIGKGMSLMHYQNLDIPIIDIEHRIFRQSFASSSFADLSLDSTPRLLLSNTAQQSNPQDSRSEKSGSEKSGSEESSPVSLPTQRHLLITSNLQGDLHGIPINSQPMLRRVPESAFKPLPAAYRSSGSIGCVSALIMLVQGDRPIFLLDLHQVMQSSQLPGTNHF